MAFRLQLQARGKIATFYLNVQARCRYCGVCWENYTCECPTSTRAGVSCKHVHAVVTYLQPTIGAVPPSLQQARPPVSPLDNCRDADAAEEIRQTFSGYKGDIESATRVIKHKNASNRFTGIEPSVSLGGRKSPLGGD
jgi:hypothetical protein